MKRSNVGESFDISGFPTTPKPTSSAAQEVHHYVLRTLQLVTQWMDRAAEDADAPTCQWKDSAHLANARHTVLETSIRQLQRAKVVTKAENVLAPVLGESVLSEKEVFAMFAQTLQDSVNPWTRRFLDKLYSAPSTISPALELLLGALNASPTVSSAAPALCLAEEQTVQRLASVLGWESELADGLTMAGGSASNVLAVQTALGNAFPSFKLDGVMGASADLTALYRRKGKAARPVVLTSELSHYSLEKAGLACGMGLNSVIKIKCDARGRMDVGELDRVLREMMGNVDDESACATAGYPFFVSATAGTTILGAFDDIAAIVETCRRAQPVSSQGPPIWVHVDASWGGPVMFSATSSHLLAGVWDADSVTFNPHKALNVTQQCSFALFRHGMSLCANITGAKYLFHGTQSDRTWQEYSRRNPGAKTMGCGRRADAFKFYIEWLRVGSSGFGQHIERGIGYAQVIREVIVKRYSASLELSKATPDPIYLQVCFRPRPPAFLTAFLAKELAEMARETQVTAVALHFRLVSRATHFVHSSMRCSGRYQVDKAPVHYPSDAGYYIRLVTHPNTPFTVFQELIEETSRLGTIFFEELLSSVGKTTSQSITSRAILQWLIGSGND